MPISPKIAVHIFVSGHVQGVGFRAWAASQARHLGIYGWIRNCPDGSVELIAEANPETLETFTEILKEGNTWSSIKNLTVNPTIPHNYSDFSIEI